MKLGTPRVGPGHWDPSHGLRCSSELTPKSPISLRLSTQEKNHRFNGRYEELTGDLKHTCPEIDDEERCGRALFWEYSTKQPLFECKWQDLNGDMQYACRERTADAAAAPKTCTMCKFLGHPAAEPANAAPLEASEKLLDQALQPAAAPKAAPKEAPKGANTHEGTVAQYQLCLEGASTLSQVRTCPSLFRARARARA